MSEGLSVPRLGVPGVLGLSSEPEADFLVGVPGAGGGALAFGLDFTRLNALAFDSDDMAALNFL
jgi:hypothetical protein